MKLNLSSQWYYTQRNNSIDPSAACMPTARCMYYRGNGIPFNTPVWIADDDWLMQNLRGADAEEFAKRNYPWAVGNDGTLIFPPNEIHGMYNRWLDYRVCGHRTSDFHTALSLEDFIVAVKQGEVIMTSGKFPGIPGHAFCVIGWDGTEFHLADPWGNWRTGYRNHDGYDVKMSVNEWLVHVNPVRNDKKWGHRPRERAA